MESSVNPIDPFYDASGENALRPAGIFVRYAAHVIDLAIFSLICAVGVFLFGASNMLFGWSSAFLGLLFVALGLSLFAANWMYNFLWHWNGGQTLGKRWLGLMVIGEDNPHLTFRQANIRWMGYFLTALTLGVGFLAGIFRKEKRALHDSFSNSRVVHVDVRRVWLEVLSVLLLGWLPILAPIMAVNVVGSTCKYYFASSPPQQTAAEKTRSSLAALRESLLRYRMEFGHLPNKISDDTFPGREGYIARFPAVRLPKQGHPESFAVVRGPRVLEDSGRWVYDPQKGQVYVDCTHTDVHGTTIYSW